MLLYAQRCGARVARGVVTGTREICWNIDEICWNAAKSE